MGANSSDHNNPKFEGNQKKFVKSDPTNLLEQKNEPEMSNILKNSSKRDQTEPSELSNSDSIFLLTENKHTHLIKHTHIDGVSTVSDRTDSHTHVCMCV